VTKAAAKLMPAGLVCAPGESTARPATAICMYAMAKTLSPVVAEYSRSSFPPTAAGLDVLEDCIAEGITITATVSFTVPPGGSRLPSGTRAGIQRARRRMESRRGNATPVIMIGRLDDYLREVAHDNQARGERIRYLPGWSGRHQAAPTPSIRTAATTRLLLVAALRGDYHLTELGGADLVMSIHPEPIRIFFVSKDFPARRADRPAGVG